MKKLSELTQQEPILIFEMFTIRPFDGWTLWLERDTGEGTQIRKTEFLNMLAKLWEKNF